MTRSSVKSTSVLVGIHVAVSHRPWSAFICPMCASQLIHTWVKSTIIFDFLVKEENCELLSSHSFCPESKQLERNRQNSTFLMTRCRWNNNLPAFSLFVFVKPGFLLSSETEAFKTQGHRQLEILFKFIYILIKSEMEVKRLGRQGCQSLWTCGESVIRSVTL